MTLPIIQENNLETAVSYLNLAAQTNDSNDNASINYASKALYLGQGHCRIQANAHALLAKSYLNVGIESLAESHAVAGLSTSNLHPATAKSLAKTLLMAQSMQGKDAEEVVKSYIKFEDYFSQDERKQIIADIFLSNTSTLLNRTPRG